MGEHFKKKKKPLNVLVIFIRYGTWTTLTFVLNFFSYEIHLQDGGMNESRFSESLRKRTEVPAVANRQSTVAVHPDPPVPAVRKRHHTLTDGDHIMMSPLTRMPALPPLPNQNITIFQMLQQFDKFES